MKINFTHSQGGCWPSAAQKLLLRACLPPRAAALAAWQRWCRQADFDRLDGGSYRLMPLVYHNLGEALAGDALEPRIKGIYLHNWTRNQMLFHAVAGVLAALNRADIRVILLKGAALATRHYRDAALRPMGDFDFMVHRDEALEAFAVLQQLGWNWAETMPQTQALWCSYAAKFRNARGQEVDVHWHLLPEGRQADADAAIWAGAREIDFQGVRVQCANPSDLLLHVCAHGAVNDVVPPIRWIADAWTIINHSPEPLDWERLVALAQKRELTLSVGRALKFLSVEFGVPVPVDVLEAMQNTRHSWLERWVYQIKSSPHPLAGALPLHCANYLRLMAGRNFPQKILGLPRFFQNVWGLARARDIPAYLTRKVSARLARSWKVEA